MPACPSLRHAFAIAAAAATLLFPHAAGSDEILFVQLGGMPVLTAVVHETLTTMAANPRVNQSFDGVNLAHTEQHIVQEFCALTGGPCEYVNDDIRTIHRGLNISESEFYAMVETLELALDHQGVSLQAKNRLLRLLAPMKRDVVTR